MTTASQTTPPTTAGPTAPAPWLPVAAGAVTLVMWASAFVVIRHVAHDVSPGALGSGRLLVAALVVLPLVLRRGWVRPNRREWTLLALGGVGWFGVYNLALNAGERHVDAGTAAMIIQIGPVIRGTAIRDSLDFVNFNEFKNQIQWAEFGKAFNNHLNAVTLDKLPREALEGQKVEAVGAYPLPSKGQLPLLTPATITIGG